ncbi:hypothetical protein [Bradyrhizobium sp. 142]|nr:hypothetical protein [Bradyrhizobium sp. 142]MCK1732017.1 hypothetical protein [Bradyrhizobium sp. 142]
MLLIEQLKLAQAEQESKAEIAAPDLQKPPNGNVHKSATASTSAAATIC